MSTAVVVPVEEYLSTSYEPDREYVDGRLVERNAGEHDHSVLQAETTAYLAGLKRELKIQVFTEQRLQLSATPYRYRIPDVCAVQVPYARSRVLSEPPLVVIEILSPDDRMSQVTQKLKEYLRFGVPNVWLVDPEQRTVSFADLDGLHEVHDRRLLLTASGSSATIDFNVIFDALG